MRMHFITPYHIMHVSIYAFIISYFILMHTGSSEGTTLLEFNEEEEEHQEAPQPVALEGEEQALEDLPECSNHWPTSFLKGKPQSILSLLCFTKYHLSPLCLMHQVIRVELETLDAQNYLVQINIPLTLCRSRIKYMLSHAYTGRSRVISCHQ